MSDRFAGAGGGPPRGTPSQFLSNLPCRFHFGFSLVSMDQQPGQSFVKDKLNDLGQRQMDLEHGLGEVQQELESLDREAVDSELVRSALGQVMELFGVLKPYEQRELMQLMLQ